MLDPTKALTVLNMAAAIN